MALGHKLCAPLITIDLPQRDFITSTLMWSSPINCVQISETKYRKGGNHPAQEQLVLALA